MSKQNSIGFISLGCPKALVDSEQIVSRLKSEGYEISHSYQDCSLVIVNTCGFIDDAVAESLDAIGEAMDKNGQVIVTGCLGARGNLVKDKYPNVLAVSGPHADNEVVQQVHKYLPPEHDPYTSILPPGGLKLTPRHYAYLKISEGCNHNCSFCIIPDLRGRLQSRSIRSVIEEAEQLLEAGVKELLVVSQDTSAYGLDLKYPLEIVKDRTIKTDFYHLAKELGQLGLWVRMHYVYPYLHVDKIIPLMADNVILPYLDIPLQHANYDVLKNMKRPANQENMLRRIEQWRDICPDISLRSTFIVGFPGETEAQFNELLDFLREIRFDRVGAFAYSAVDGARANELPNAVEEELKQQRLEQFMACQAEISRDKLAGKIDDKLTVIVDSEDEKGVIARTMYDAPEIDGLVFVDNVEGTEPGQLLNVRIIDSSDHDLWGEVI